MEEQVVKTVGMGRMLMPGAMARPVAATLTPKEVLGMVRRHMWLIVLLTIGGLGSGVGGWYVSLRYWPRYTAMTFVKVLSSVDKDPTTIAGAATSKDIEYGHRLSLAGRLKSQSMLQQLVDRDKIQATKWFQSQGKTKDERIRKAVKNLRERLGAAAQRDGDSIIVSMTCGDKDESADIVNEMVDLFVSVEGGKRREEISAKLKELQGQSDRVDRDLLVAERALEDVRKRYGFADLEEHAFQPVIDRKLLDLELQQNVMVMDIRQTRASIDRLREQATGPVQVQVERQVETDPVMTMLAQQLSLRESDLASVLARFGEDHRVVRQVREMISAIEEERIRRKTTIGEQVRQSNLRNAQDQLTTMESRLLELEKMREEASNQKKELDTARSLYQQRLADRDERRTMLDSLKVQIEKYRLMYDDPAVPKLALVGYAPRPLEVSFPRWEIFWPGGGVLGLMLGIGLALLIEVLNDLVRMPRDVARHLHIPLLGVIPDADEDEEVEDINLALLVRHAPYAMASESYRKFATNLRLSAPAETSKVLFITSGSAGDGKTSVAVNLASVFVAEGKKVLLVDTNFRRPTVHEMFPAGAGEQQAGPGLSSLLAGRCAVEQAVRASDMEGLSVVDAGPAPASPMELLGGTRMQGFIKQQRERFDYVILDGPPVLLMSEAKLLARAADGAILVFNAAATRRGAAQRTISELKEVNAKVLGCVLLAVRMLKGGYFREQSRSYRDYLKVQLAGQA